MRKLMEAVKSDQENFSIEFEMDHADPDWIGWAYRDYRGEIVSSGNDLIRDIPEIVNDILAGVSPE